MNVPVYLNKWVGACVFCHKLPISSLCPCDAMHLCSFQESSAQPAPDPLSEEQQRHKAEDDKKDGRGKSGRVKAGDARLAGTDSEC